MHGPFPALLFMLVLPLGVVLLVFYGIIRLFKPSSVPPKGQDTQAQSDETRMIQEMYQGLTRMEQRIEALETILLDGDSRDSRDARDGRRSGGSGPSRDADDGDDFGFGPGGGHG